jgi:FAD/FMN-containing dehydrogenase
MDGMKEGLIKLVGEERVCDSNEILERYSKDGSFAQPLRPSLVVKVQDASEVEKIVQLANRTQTPLVPVSSGGPHYKGDTVPSMPEAVIVDLSGMKKILKINRQQRIAVVEPGVTYGELQEALAQGRTDAGGALGSESGQVGCRQCPGYRTPA